MLIILCKCYDKFSKNILIVPSTVNNLNCVVTSPTQVNINWERPSQPNGVIRHYEIVLRDLNTMDNITTFVKGLLTYVAVNHLRPNHNYSCSVAAHTVVRGSFATAVYISLPRFRMYSIAGHII